MKLAKTFSVKGMTYRIIDIRETLVDDDGTECWTRIDHEQRILWVWHKATQAIRETAILQASGNVWLTAIGEPTSDLPLVD